MSPRGVIARAAVLLLLAGCAADPQDPGLQPSGPSAAKDRALVGRTFVSTAVSVGGQPQPLVTGTRAVVGFTDEGVTLAAGCNQMAARAAYADGQLTVAAVGGTEMGCDADRMDQDAWLAGFLADDPRYLLDGDALTLTGADTVIELAPEPAEPTADLVGTTWRLEGFVDGSGQDATVGSVPGGLHPQLRVQPGRLTAGLGCNGGGGRVVIDDDALRVRAFAQTLMGCGGNGAEVERLVTRVLGSGRVSYLLDGQTLTLTRGEHGLVYRAAH